MFPRSGGFKSLLNSFLVRRGGGGGALALEEAADGLVEAANVRRDIAALPAAGGGPGGGRMRGPTEFQRAVHKTVRTIPEGKVTTYAAVASKSGYPGAAQSVGNALRVGYDGTFPPVVASGAVRPEATGDQGP